MNSPDTQNMNAANGNGHALAMWEPRRALTLDAARKHSRLVRLLRRLLMGLAGLLLGVLAWFFISVPKTITPVDNPDETVKMIHPVYKGRTSDGLPYRITAKEAVRLIANPTETSLVDPVLNFLRDAGSEESQIIALKGLYNSEQQILELYQSVHLKTDDGYDCKTAHARIYVKKKRIEGDKPIECSGSFGLVRGHAFEINDNYQEFVFKNGMQARIIQESSRTDPLQTDPAKQDAQTGEQK